MQSRDPRIDAKLIGMAKEACEANDIYRNGQGVQEVAKCVQVFSDLETEIACRWPEGLVNPLRFVAAGYLIEVCPFRANMTPNILIMPVIMCNEAL